MAGQAIGPLPRMAPHHEDRFTARLLLAATCDATSNTRINDCFPAEGFARWSTGAGRFRASGAMARMFAM
jgi:hypothetical protein